MSIDLTMVKKLLLIILGLIFVSCGGGVLVVDTLPPSAEIFVRSKTKNDFTLVGKAPYKLTADELKGKYEVDSSFVMEARLPGYDPQTLLVSELAPNTEMNVFLNLKNSADKAALENGGKGMSPEILNRTMDQLFESQRLVKVGRYDDALAELNRIQEANPNLSAVFEMQGGVFYIQKNYVKALDSYEKALRLNPENLELLSMKRYLENFVKKDDGSKGTAKN